MGDGGEEAIFGFFEKGDHLGALNGREANEKFINGVTRFEVIHQGLHGHAGSREARGAAHDFRVAGDELLLHGC